MVPSSLHLLAPLVDALIIQLFNLLLLLLGQIASLRAGVVSTATATHNGRDQTENNCKDRANKAEGVIRRRMVHGGKDL